MMTDSDETIAEASLCEGPGDRPVKVCTECGRELDPRRWTPTVATSEDGKVRVYLFCGERCRDAWRARRDA